MASSPLKIIFAGTPEFAAVVLAALLETPHQLVAVYTQPDRPSGRGRQLTQSPVKQLAEQHNLPVYQPLHLREPETHQLIASHQADIMVVVAYGLILPQVVLDIPPLGCLNVHASLLPRWRGAAPINRAIEAGDEYSGVTIMQMEAGLDTGPMLASSSIALAPDETAATLHDILADMGAELLVEVLQDYPHYQAQAIPQDHTQATYAKKLLKSEGALDFSQSAYLLDRRIRAYDPWPGSYTFLQSERLKILFAVPQEFANPDGIAPGTICQINRNSGIGVMTGEGLLWLATVQKSGGKPMDAWHLAHGQSLLQLRLEIAPET